MTEIETGSKIPIWWTFGLIQWYVIPAPRATLHGERIPSAILKVVFRRIAYFFVFLMQFGFGERRLSYRLRYTSFMTVALSSAGTAAAR